MLILQRQIQCMSSNSVSRTTIETCTRNLSHDSGSVRTSDAHARVFQVDGRGQKGL